MDIETLQGMLRSGQVAPSDLVWREGMPEWTPASTIPELSGGAGAPPPPPPTMTPPGGLQIPQAGPVAGYGAPAQGPVAHPPIENYLVAAILVTIFCCWPLGIPAIVYAAKVDGCVARNDIAGALEASKQAKTWTWVSFGLGLGFYLFMFLIVAAGG